MEHNEFDRMHSDPIDNDNKGSAKYARFSQEDLERMAQAAIDKDNAERQVHEEALVAMQEQRAANKRNARIATVSGCVSIAASAAIVYYFLSRD